MVCVGLWGAFLGRPLIYLLPVIFPTIMAVGAVLAMIGLRLPAVEIGIALSVLVLGGCIGLAAKAPIWVASLIVAAFAIFHGYARMARNCHPPPIRSGIAPASSSRPACCMLRELALERSTQFPAAERLHERRAR